MMAEFQEVAKQKCRMCNTYNDNCDGCPLAGNDCGLLNVRYAAESEIKFIEETVMQWAAEHPEPIYPTWGDYLAEKGELCKNWKDIRVVSNADNSISGVIGWFYKNVPADIAEKLGIEPKEG